MRGIVRSAAAPSSSGATALGDRPVDVDVTTGGRRLGEVLVESRWARRSDVVAALELKQRGTPHRLGRLLVERGAVTEADLTAALARQCSLEVVDLTDVRPTPEALALMSDDVAHRLPALPLAIEGSGESAAVLVAVANGDDATADRVRDAVQRPVVLRLAAQSSLLRAIDTHYRALADVENQVRVFEARDGLRRDVVLE
jgi:MSHA biogenesis protein MshE